MPTSRAARAEEAASGGRGFTLVELLVVLVLLAAVAFLVVPRLGPAAPPPPGEMLRLQLVAGLEALRRRAIFEGRPAAVDPLRLAGSGERIEWTPAAGSGPGLFFTPDGRSNGGRLRLPDGSVLVIGPSGEIRRDDG
jgi:prepilin-type N-terminal cleavage/methylation domain-containing protein